MPLIVYLFIGFMIYFIASLIFSKKSYTPFEKTKLDNCIELYKSHGYIVGIPDFTELKLVLSIPATKEEIAARVYPVKIIKPDFYVNYNNEKQFFYNTKTEKYNTKDRIYIDVLTRKAYLPFRDRRYGHFEIKEIPLPIPF